MCHFKIHHLIKKLLIPTFVLGFNLAVIAQKNQEKYTSLTAEIDSILNESVFNGVISISSDTTNIYSKALGYSDLENSINIDFNDQFVIGSISKQITAVLILREFENDNLGLKDTIGKYLKEINEPWSEKITIHHLLTHTHGILDLKKPLEFEQGSQFKYSQLGYELLAQILEKVTGKTFEKLAMELFHKFELKNTFHPQNKAYKHLVKGYVENDDGTLVFTTKSLSNYVPAGSFISNAIDLKKWNSLLHSEQLVK